MAKKPKPAANYNENAEWTADDFARAKPFSEVFPEAFESWKRRGRPPVERPKKQITLRLHAEIVDRLKASGPGYNAFAEKALAEAFEKIRAHEENLEASDLTKSLKAKGRKSASFTLEGLAKRGLVKSALQAPKAAKKTA